MGPEGWPLPYPRPQEKKHVQRRRSQDLELLTCSKEPDIEDWEESIQQVEERSEPTSGTEPVVEGGVVQRGKEGESAPRAQSQNGQRQKLNLPKETYPGLFVT